MVQLDLIELADLVRPEQLVAEILVHATELVRGAAGGA